MLNFFAVKFILHEKRIVILKTFSVLLKLAHRIQRNLRQADLRENFFSKLDVIDDSRAVFEFGTQRGEFLREFICRRYKQYFHFIHLLRTL